MSTLTDLVPAAAQAVRSTDVADATDAAGTPATAEPPAPVEASATARCTACAATDVEPLLDLGTVPVLPDGGSPECGETSAAPMALARCGRCDILQVAGTLDDTDREQVACATAQRSFAGRPAAARRFAEDAIDRWKLTGDGHVVEIGSGTGSLLRFFRAWQLPVLGIEADARLTRYARLRRIPTWPAEFDGAAAGRMARSGVRADLVVVSTPLGAFASLQEMFGAITSVLRPGGVMTLEIPDVLRVVGRTRFDALRHADRVLPSIGQLARIVAPFGLDVVDVERADVGDERLRVWLRRRERGASTVGHPRLRTRLRAEAAAGVEHPDTLAAFVRRATLVLRHVGALLDDAAREGRTVTAFGASPDAVTTAAAVGLDARRVTAAVDPERSPVHRHLPGTDVAMLGLADAADHRPDLVLGLDELPEAPAGWEGVPVYAVADLVDVVHRLTTEHAVHFAR